MGSENDEVDVGAPRLADHGEGAQDVDPLLALALDDPLAVGSVDQPASGVAFVAVLQRPLVHGDPGIALPAGFLSLVARVGLGVMLGRGLAAVDQHPGQDRVIHPGALGAVAGADQLVAEVHGVDQRLVSGKMLADMEELVRGQMHVLIVDDDSSPKFRHRYLLLNEKAPPVPEDGGELGHHDAMSG